MQCRTVEIKTAAHHARRYEVGYVAQGDAGVGDNTRKGVLTAEATVNRARNDKVRP